MGDERLLQTMAALPEDDADGGGIPASRVPSAAASSGMMQIPPSRPSLSSIPDDGMNGQVLDGRYIVEKVLGEGGMGVVYRARHKVLDKKVALKVLRPDLARDPDILERFVQEAKAATSIGNPHIIDIIDFGQLADGSTYFAMEMLDGLSLGQVIAGANGEPLSIERVVSIGAQIADGLGAAHRGGIVHRDLKPDNVMLVDRNGAPDFVKVLDFGIAKVASTKEKITRVGQIFGTPHYMSPEQAAGLPVDSRTDIYSLGVILYEMTSGKVPFDADNFMGILTQHMYKAPVPILALIPQPLNVPPGLDAIILKCLDKRPEFRYSTMEELGVDLHKLAMGEVPGALPDRMQRNHAFAVTSPPSHSQGRMPIPMPMDAPDFKSSGIGVKVAVGVGSALAVALLVGGGALMMRSHDNADAQQMNPPVPPSTVASGATPDPATSAPIAVPAQTTTHVTVKLTPDSARLSRDGATLTPPFVFDIAPAETITLTASAPGYRSLDIALDASNPAPVYKLTPAGASGSTTRPTAVPSAKPTPITPITPTTPAKKKCGEGVDPWDCVK